MHRLIESTETPHAVCTMLPVFYGEAVPLALRTPSPMSTPSPETIIPALKSSGRGLHLGVSCLWTQCSLIVCGIDSRCF